MRPVEVRQRVVRVEVALVALDGEADVGNVGLSASGRAAGIGRARVLRARVGVRQVELQPLIMPRRKLICSEW